jgi:6-methylsalicylic acid synthase
VSAMGFPWRVAHHVASENEMLARVYANPNSLPGICTRLAEWPRQRPRHDGRLWAYGVGAQSARGLTLSSEEGTVLMEIQGMAFAGVEGESLSRKSTSGLVLPLSCLWYVPT